MTDLSKKEKLPNDESAMLSLRGDLNLDALKSSISKVINGQEVMKHFINEGREHHKIQNRTQVMVYRMDMKSSLSDRKNDAIREWLKEYNAKNFDFTNGLFIKVSLMQLPEKENLLLITGSHIISDAWSIDYFCEELKVLYESQVINAGIDSSESVEFKEYIKWRNEEISYGDSNAIEDTFVHKNRIINNLKSYFAKQQLNLELYGLQNETNIKFYVLNYYMQKVPSGTIGDLYIGKNETEKYYTNNLAMINEAGDLKIFGNKDEIIDIRGRNVTLKFIDNRIETVPYIRQDNKPTIANKIIEYLREGLPEYMKPKYFLKTSLSVDSSDNLYDKKLENKNDGCLNLNFANSQCDKVKKNSSNIISKIEEKEYYPVVGMQKRLFIMNQLSPKDVSYNCPIVLAIEGSVDIAKLENAFRKIIDRHETFRTFFKLMNGVPAQFIDERCDFKLNTLRIQNNDIDTVIKEFIVPFDLSQAPLLRANYIEIGDDSKILIIDMHHIIADGISGQIFAKELIEIYKGNTLNEIDIQYKDYLQWKNNNISLEKMKKLEEYWLEKIKDFSYTSLPKKYELNDRKDEGRNKEIYFNSEEYLKINMFCKKNSITKFTYFTAILNIILMNEIGKNDISIGIPVSGRNHNQVQDLIGLFLNLVLIRTNIDKNKTLEEYLHIVNEDIIGALSYQEYPYEDLYNIVSERYGIKNGSLFSIMLNYMPYIDENNESDIKVGGVTFKLHKETNYHPKYDVTFYVKENKEEMVINMVYKNIFQEHVIERIAKAFHNISEIILNNSMMEIKNIEYSQVIDEDQGMSMMDDYFENEEFFI